VHFFISYAKRDTRDLATQLYDELNALDNVTAWMDGSLQPASSWALQIQDEIDRCDYMIVLLSPDVNRKPTGTQRRSFVLNEIDYAQQINKPIIPVMAEQTRMPVQIAGVQYIDFANNPDMGMQSLLDAINQRMGRQTALPVELPDTPKPPPSISTSEPVGEPKPKSEPKPMLPVIVFSVVGIVGAVMALIMIVSIARDLNRQSTSVEMLDGPSQTPTETDVPTVTDEPSSEPTFTLTLTDEPTFTLTVTDEPTLELSDTDVPTDTPESTLDAVAIAQAVMLENQTATQEAIFGAQTATATLWTKTPTPDITGTVDFYLTQWAEETATQAYVNATASATFWTRTPTPTLTPTVSPYELAKTPVASNDDWTPYEEDIDGVTMVLVPVGCFMMGSYDGFSNERPVEEQCITEPFWIDKYEVTNANYGSVGCEIYSSEPEQPRNCVTWVDAKDYCEGRGGRLPTELEWEYVAKGPDNLVYPWGNQYIAENIISEDNPIYGNETTAPVGSRPDGASWVGAMDMSGNVMEWTSSLYEDYPYEVAREAINDESSERVVRGGSSYSTADRRIAGRSYGKPNAVDDYTGFRCVRS